MSILFAIFLSMLKIGCFAFGGGYAIIALLENEFISKRKWIDYDEFLDVVAVAESTPGPIAINMATFVGSTQAGILGSAFATLGVVLPSLVIILLISAVMKNFLKYEGVKAFLTGVRPCVVSLILGTGVTLCLSTLFSFKSIAENSFSPDVKGIIIFAVVLASSLVYKKLRGKKPSPILVIAISAVLGMVLYSL